jgi:predicted dienelactone hydrolase
MRTNGLWILALVTACGGSGASPGVDGPGATADAPADSVITDGSPVTGDPAADGPATVTTSTTSIPGKTAGRMLPATVYTPSSSGPRALVVVSPGFQMQRTQYASYARHLATWGFAVVLTDYAESGFGIDHARIAADVPAVIDWALAQATLAVDAQKVAAAGHSLGGKVSVFAATLDPRIKAIVAWDPVDSNNPSVAPEKMATLTAALAVVGETTNGSGGFMPCAPTADNFQTFYAAAPAPALAMTIDGADHMDWVDDPSCGVCGFCTAGSAMNERARTATRRLDVAWLRRQLFGDTAMDVWLDVPPEIAAGTATVVRK